MLDPTALFAWEPHVDQRTVRADTLVVTLGSYTDAGGVQRQVDEHLLAQLPNRVIGRFDADQVVDYGGRRPTIHFDRDRFTSYDAPQIALHQVTDRDGTNFLLLNGPEPALQWERMSAGIAHVVEQLAVRRTVLVQSMPAPTPHTRPVPVTRFASDHDLLDDEVPMLGTFSLSASFTGVLTLRLGEAGHDVVGLLAHVPHYVADSDYPAAAGAVLGALREMTHLAVPTEGFDVAASLVRAQIEAQIANNDEVTDMVAALENGYDEFTQQRQVQTAAHQQLPSGDEFAAQFEDFLATLPDTDEGTDDEGDPEQR